MPAGWLVHNGIMLSEVAPKPAAWEPAQVAAVRFAAGFLLGFAPGFLDRYVSPSSSLAVLDWAAAVHLANALLGGPVAWLGGACGDLAASALYRPLGALQVIRVLSVALPGLLGHVLFSRSRRYCRTLPDLPSYLALFLLALVGGAFSGAIASRVVFKGFNWVATLIWSAGLGTSTLLVTPLLLLAGAATTSPLFVRETRHCRDRSRWLRRPHLVVALASAPIVALGVVLLGERLPAAAGWLLLLLVAPVVWAAESSGLRGGVLAASTVGISFLALRSLLPGAGPPLDTHLEAISVLPPLVLFSLIGALRGAAWDRERTLTSSLERTNRQLREDLEQTVRAFTSAIEAKDTYTQRHVSRVADLAMLVGRRLGMDGADLEALHWAATLHDLGKIGVPEAVLNKPAPLSDEEQVQVRRHPEIGARILSHIPGMRAAAPLVLHHQERWDGREDGQYPGYPEGLAGETIPLGSRVIAVVDAFDAMTSDRPYRRARSEEAAAEELRRQSGTQFDPRVVASFLETVAEGDR